MTRTQMVVHQRAWLTLLLVLPLAFAAALGLRAHRNAALETAPQRGAQP